MTQPTDLYVSPRSFPVWQGGVGVSVKIVGMWGKPARQLYVGKGGVLVYIDESRAYRTAQNIQDGATLTGRFYALIATGSSAHSIIVQE